MQILCVMPMWYFLKKKKIFWKLIMFILKSSNLRNGCRFKKKLFYIKNYDNKILFNKKFVNKKNNYYQHKFTKKKVMFAYFNFKSNFFNTKYFCVNFFKTYNKYIGQFKNNKGAYVILPLVNCMQLENQINLYKNVFRLFMFLYTGSLIKLKYYDLLFIVCNLGLIKPTYSLSMGTYCVINNKKKHFVIITLPSGKRIKHTNFGFAIFGRNTGIFSYKQYFGKASSSLLQKNITVRSVAKNPVDHPNGGRTRGKMCFKTPWGLVAKATK